MTLVNMMMIQKPEKVYLLKVSIQVVGALGL
jgi:hypothetical protein